MLLLAKTQTVNKCYKYEEMYDLFEEKVLFNFLILFIKCYLIMASIIHLLKLILNIQAGH